MGGRARDGSLRIGQSQDSFYDSFFKMAVLQKADAESV